MAHKPRTNQEIHEALIRRDKFSPADPLVDLPADVRAMLIRATNAYKRHLAYLEASEREFAKAKHLIWALRSHGVGGGRIALALGVSRQRVGQLVNQMRDVYEPRRARAKAGKVVRPDGTE